MPREQIDDRWMDLWMDLRVRITHLTFVMILSRVQIPGLRVHEYESDDDEHTGLASNRLLRTLKRKMNRTY